MVSVFNSLLLSVLEKVLFYGYSDIILSFELYSTCWARLCNLVRYLENFDLLWWKLSSKETKLRWNCLKNWKNLVRST